MTLLLWTVFLSYYTHQKWGVGIPLALHFSLQAIILNPCIKIPAHEAHDINSITFPPSLLTSANILVFLPCPHSLKTLASALLYKFGCFGEHVTENDKSTEVNNKEHVFSYPQ